MNRIKKVLLLALTLSLAACGGSIEDPSDESPENQVSENFDLGGSVSGLSGILVLKNIQNSNSLTLNDNGDFTFANSLSTNDPYAVVIDTQPNMQICSVTNGTGNATSVINNIQITCHDIAADSYLISGTVTGLESGSLTLSLNGSEFITLASTDSQFQFSTRLNAGDQYGVSISVSTSNAQTNQTCSIEFASGVIANAHINNIQITCRDIAANSYLISGTVTGLESGSLTLSLNDSEFITLASTDSKFQFSTKLNTGDKYGVSISVSTSSAQTNQTCSIEFASGVIANVHINNIQITCRDIAANSYFISGTVTGLESGSLTLSLNDSEFITLASTDSKFQFSKKLNTGDKYGVSISLSTSSAQTNQTCSIEFASGVIANVHINNIQITCRNIVANSYFISGTVTGLESDSLTLSLNDSEFITLASTDSKFQFSTKLNTGDKYEVSISDSTSSAQTNQSCSIAFASGVIANVHINNIALTCIDYNGFNLQPFGIQTNAPSSVVVAGLRVTDRVTGNPIEGLGKAAFVVKENDQVLGLEAFVDAEQASDATLDLRTVLILDVSTSLLPSDIATIKTAAKAALYNEDTNGNKTPLLVDGQTVAIYTFDSTVTLISDFTNNLDDLATAINGIDESLVNRGNSTNLLGAITTGLARWKNYFGLDSAQYGYAIVISDGDHNTDNRTASDIKNITQGKDIFAIALGSNVSTESLAQITGSSERVYNAATVGVLQTVLYEAQQAALKQTKGLYRVYYATPKRSGSQSISITLKNNQDCTIEQFALDNCTTELIGTYSANGFTDVVPEVKISTTGASIQTDGSQVALQSSIVVKAKLRWINVSPDFSFILENTEGPAAVLSKVSNSEYTLSIPVKLGQTELRVSEINTQVSNSIIITGDADGDGMGNNLDTDDDNDGAPDTNDAFPLDPNETTDTDGDGVGDNADDLPNDATETVDTDGDGVGDNTDFAPNDASETVDTDGDGVGDNADVFPNDATETVDTDGDGVGDNIDFAPNDASETVDTDGDGVGDNADAFPSDATETLDTDGDGVGNNADVFPNDATETVDTDGDWVGDNADAFPNDATEILDTDGDGVGNNADVFPNDATETVDSDGDGVGNNADVFPNDATETLDTDGDGVGDNADDLPNDATETVDTDGDGVGDNADVFPNDATETLDSDGDGVGDNADAFPNDATETLDTDSDGVGDNADLYPNNGTRFGYIISGSVSSDAASITVLIDGEQQSIANGQSFSFELLQGTPYQLELPDILESQNCTWDDAQYTANADKTDYAVVCENRPVVADVVANISDANFAACITAQVSVTTYADQITSLNCSSMQITDVSGLEFFTGLTTLHLTNNQLTSVDLSANTALTALFLGDNQFTSVNVSANTALMTLYLYTNQLTSVDLSANTELRTLFLSDNQFTSVDVSANTALTSLYLDNNQLSSMDLSANTTLTGLYLYNNQLTSLDLSNNTALTILYISGNQLTSLDVSASTALTQLYLYNNQLTSVNVSANTALTTLWLGSNQLTSVDVSANTALTYLGLSGNQLTSVDVSANTALTSLSLSGSQLTSVDVSANTELRTLLLSDNQLTSVDVAVNTALTFLALSGNQLTSVDVSSNMALTILWLHYNQLTNAPIGISNIANTAANINLTNNNFDVNAEAELTSLKDTYPNLSW